MFLLKDKAAFPLAHTSCPLSIGAEPCCCKGCRIKRHALHPLRNCITALKMLTEGQLPCSNITRKRIRISRLCTFTYVSHLGTVGSFQKFQNRRPCQNKRLKSCAYSLITPSLFPNMGTYTHTHTWTHGELRLPSRAAHITVHFTQSTFKVSELAGM